MTDSIVQQKTCIQCHETKFVSEFYRHNLSPDGLTLKCKACTKPRGVSLRRRVQRACEKCGQQFEARAHLVKKGKANFCSLTCGRGIKRKPLIDRFWEKVQKTDTCWLWTAGKNFFGYGNFGVRRNGKYGSRCAHIVSYELANSPVPEGLYVLHKCDNPPCVRPDHLYLGTKHDNNQDMVTRGRTTSPLTAEQVREMRALYAAGTMGYVQLANHFGITRGSVRQIILRITWVHLP